MTEPKPRGDQRDKSEKTGKRTERGKRGGRHISQLPPVTTTSQAPDAGSVDPHERNEPRDRGER